MENLAAFVAGTLIFGTYMFFLLRMIYKQHQIQERGETKVVRLAEDTTQPGVRRIKAS